MFSSVVSAGINTEAVLSPFLKECYSETKLLDRNYLPPMTLPVLLDILRKIEDHPSILGNMRQIATGIVHLLVVTFTNTKLNSHLKRLYKDIPTSILQISSRWHCL